MTISLSFTETIAPPDVQVALTPKRRSKLKWVLLALAIFAVTLIGFGAFVATRGGADFEGDLAQLLPPETAFFIAMDNIGEMLDHTRQTSVFKKLTILYPPSELLLSDHDLKNLKKSGVPFDRAKADATFGPFLRRWFGRQVAVALVPAANSNKGSLVAVARTDAGFEENLAELVALVWLHPTREKAVYQDVPMTLFKGDDPGQSIGYCRFGRTIVVSIYEDSFEPLKAIIDRRQNTSLPTLASVGEFQQYRKDCSVAQGLSAFVRTDSTFNLLQTYKKFNFEKHPNGYANFLFFADLLKPLGKVCGTLSVKSQSQGEALSLRFFSPASQPVSSEKGLAHRIPHLFASNTLVYAGGRSDHLPETVRRWTFGFPQGSAIRDSSDKWKEIFVHDFDVDLEKEVIPQLSGEIGLGMIDFKPSLLVPQVRLALLMRVRDVNATQKLLDGAYKHYQSRLSRGKSLRWKTLQRDDSGGSPIYYLTTVYGVYACTIRNGYLGIIVPEALLPQMKKLLATDNPPAGISDSPLLAGIANADQLPLLAVADTRLLSRNIKAMGEQWSALSKSSKDDFEAQQPMLDLLDALGSVRLTRQNGSDGDTVELLVPLQ